jgi:putative acetyltransferase
MPEPQITIRPFASPDTDAVMTVWRQANALAHPFLPAVFVAQTERDVRDIYLPNAESYVLEAGGEIAGFISLLGNEIGGLFLDPARHGTGLGWALVSHAMAIEGPLKVEVFKDNRIGLPFYQRCGFELVAEELHEPSGQLCLKMAMPGGA